MNNEIKYLCPVCGYGLGTVPWTEDGIPSDQICPQCGIHFGYDDLRNGDFRLGVYQGWRNKWRLEGSNFWSKVNSAD